MLTHGSIFREGSGIGHRVECEGECHAMTCYWHTEAQALSAWNHRSHSTIIRNKQELLLKAEKIVREAKYFSTADDLANLRLALTPIRQEGDKPLGQ